MNKVEQNAIKIAELLGYELVPSLLGTEVYFHVGDSFTQKEVKRLFSSYQGLMPIVFECNNNTDCEIQIESNQIDFWGINNGLTQSPYDKVFQYTTESGFVEAIQLACIKYLELKNGN
jgi:hypothetical protein